MKSPLEKFLPSYPHTRHLPFKANAARDDLVAASEECEIIFEDNVHFSEKCDGSNSAICFYEGNPIIRNRDHILNKGFVKNTPAKKQFASVFTWFYKNKNKFEYLNKELGTLCSVFLKI